MQFTEGIPTFDHAWSLVTEDPKKTALYAGTALLAACIAKKLLFTKRAKPTDNWQKQYDFIVVGAGSAGCVLANRLSADGRFSVLLLEAGGEETAQYLRIEAPILAPAACSHPDIIWDDSTTPQPSTSKAHIDQKICTQHGKVLGGSSSVNWMVYVRGHRADYDSWEKLGCPGWGWSSIEKYFQRMENYFLPHDELGHGGPVTVTENLPDWGMNDKLIEAAAELGVKHNRKYNCGNNQGISRSHLNRKNGSRCSAAKAYLRPAMGRKNLDVIINAHTTKIIFDGKRAVGVRFVRTGGFTHEVFARREVIISAGAINSPHLLMLSGVGPKEELDKHKIPMVADLPVGREYQDHSSVPFDMFFDRVPVPQSEWFFRQNLERIPNILRYLLFGKGLLTAGPVAAVSFHDAKDGKYLQTTDMPKFQIHYTVAPSNLELQNEDSVRFYEVINFTQEYSDSYIKNNHLRTGCNLAAVVLHPYSRGSITLASADPFDRPIIDPNILSDPRDREVAKTSLRYVRDLSQTSTMQSLGAHFLDSRYANKSKLASEPMSDEYLDQIIDYKGVVLWHPASSCKMGSTEDKTAVVDPNLRVIGLEGLRVADNSIMPHLTSGNTNAPAMMIGEKAADMILQTYTT